MHMREGDTIEKKREDEVRKKKKKRCHQRE
jgi:hypothetical protein